RASLSTHAPAREDAGAPLERRLLDLFFKDHHRAGASIPDRNQPSNGWPTCPPGKPGEPG
ncbi:MAG: hypothetical protein L0226_00250, partial [Acidobacteria bacterium]|nr:hypothetical protein [Acidobacteriota bacterium]